MCPPAHDQLNALVLNGSVEHIFMYLETRKPGSPLPEGLFEDINPYHHSPSNLPAGIMYLVNLSEKKENAFGTWEVKEEATEIFTNSSICGWRTTLRFLECQDSLEHKTMNWVMHEYKIILKNLSASNKEKESKVICRVFLSAARSSNVQDDKSKVYTKAGMNIINTMVSIFPKNDNSKQGSTSGSVGKKVAKTEKVMNPFLRDLSEEHHMLNGDYMELDDLADPLLLDCDYLELDDLAEPLSRSSSSDNSSLFSLTSDEYFDPNTLLQELEDHNSNYQQQGKDASSKFSVTSSVKPFEVVVQPATSGSLVSSTERKKPRRDNLTSAASNTNYPPTSEGKMKAASFLKRNKLKHLCFLPFQSLCKTF